VVIPYYNEARYIGATLRSLTAQYRLPDRIVLVDNGSTDGSAEACREALAAFPPNRVVYLRDPRPGKVNALETGCGEAGCELVALCDADVLYPPHYLERALQLFRANPGAAAVMGLVTSRDPDHDAATRQRLRSLVQASRRHPSKCLTGGAGQIFRADALRAVGGFSAALWNYVLMDHEIMNRVRRQGSSVYHEDLWCLHSDRRADRGDVRWNLFDRMLYRYAPPFLGDWFFHRYLGPRLKARKMMGLNLRRQPWAAVQVVQAS
jgi:glycosyltransferase involved in cell wall biosynthesis